MNEKEKLEKKLEKLRKEFEQQRAIYNNSVNDVEEKLRDLEYKKRKSRLNGYFNTLVHYVESWYEDSKHHEWHMIGYVDVEGIGRKRFYLENSVDISIIDGEVEHASFRRKGEGGHSITSDLDTLLKKGTCEYVDEFSGRKESHTLRKTTFKEEMAFIRDALTKDAENYKKYVLATYLDATNCFKNFENLNKK